MSNAPVQNMTAAHQLRVVVAVRDRVTGNPTDVTTPLVVSSNNAFVSAVVDPEDPRAVILTAANANGGATVTVQEDPTTPNPLQIPVNVTMAPDLSGVDFVSATQI